MLTLNNIEEFQLFGRKTNILFNYYKINFCHLSWRFSNIFLHYNKELWSSKTFFYNSSCSEMLASHFKSASMLSVFEFFPCILLDSVSLVPCFLTFHNLTCHLYRQLCIPYSLLFNGVFPMFIWVYFIFG